MIFRKEIYMIEKEIQKISNTIELDLNTSLSKNIEQVYLLGQASIISSLLHCINNLNFKDEDIKSYLNSYIKGNSELKNMTYDCMKDY
jgi:hypothetical protein